MQRGLPFLALAASLLAQTGRDLRVDPLEGTNPLHDVGARWAVVIGISQYKHLPPAAQLHYADRDAERFAAFLRTPEGGGLPAHHIHLLTNEHATLAGIRAALHTWLVETVKPKDIVYFFLAGHAVLDENDQGYFVTHDSDAQQLHATALPFQEVDSVLSERIQAGLVVLIADACHTGRLGWSSYNPGSLSRSVEPLANIGRGDRSFLKLLASSPSERSFEDQNWGGGHGVFTYSLLEGLGGEADRDGDHVVRASEVIDYISRTVPQRTEKLQHPRIAGTFDAQVALASSPNRVVSQTGGVPLDISGPPLTAVYVDHAFRGQIRSTGQLRIDALSPGVHHLSADFPGGATLEGTVALSDKPARTTLAPPTATALAQLRARLAQGQILAENGAWDFYRSQTFPAPEHAAAAALMTSALEELGQACVGDYVQSTDTGLKRVLLQTAVAAYDHLSELRPSDRTVTTRRLFCQGRLEIAEGRFTQALATLEASLKYDPTFACSHNAKGVALARLNRPKEARASFEKAASLTPEWALPQFQIASQLISTGDLAKAVPYLEKAAQFNPKSIAALWNLVHVNRVLGRIPEVEKYANAVLRLNPNYAPLYPELGQAYESVGLFAKAAEAYDAYTLLAPNFADTADIRSRADRARARNQRPVPSLRK